MNQGYRIRRIKVPDKEQFSQKAFRSSIYTGMDVNLLTLCRADFAGQSTGNWRALSAFHKLSYCLTFPSTTEFRCRRTSSAAVWDLAILFITKMDVWTEWQTWVVWLIHKLPFVTLRTAVLYEIQYWIEERHGRRLSWKLISYCLNLLLGKLRKSPENPHYYQYNLQN
jgi:hypothetical protein